MVSKIEDIVYGEYIIKRGLLYTPTHEWVRIEGNRIVVGITDYAQKKLTDIVYVEAPEIGKTVKKGEVVTHVESVKSVGDIYAPVSGKIVGWNKELEESPEKINEDPYGEGWIVMLEVENEEELKTLLKPEEYVEVIKKEESES